MSGQLVRHSSSIADSRIAYRTARRHLLAAAVLGVAFAAAAVLAFVLIIVPLVHGYASYCSDVGQMFAQAQQQYGGAP